MSANDVLEAYVGDVVRRLPRRERDEVGVELLGLLTEMLADRPHDAKGAVEDAQVLAMLRDFGTPAEVASRYRAPGMVIIPAEQTRAFVWTALLGVGLQWALTLPQVFAGQSVAQWWFSGGLGALWWPGFMLMMALAASALRSRGWLKRDWRPRVVDPDRVERLPAISGLVAIAAGVIFMVSLPWLAPAMPGPLPRVLAFDPDFLRVRAPLVLPLWLSDFALRLVVLSHGRWSRATRRVDVATSVAFIALLGWWIGGGPIFQAPLTDEGAKGALVLVIALIVFDLAMRLHRRRPRLRAPGHVA
ncbi:MAG: hypothetical protein ACOY37_12295 [Pseudomonadota bacterium]|uniref:hypothetical protein n=1 Tax=Lysobacter sp. N42 TaxID=2545719 RepID=UPI00104A319D|nr:hypothetical protein [Lysobacter sp. N42]TCZ83837.1 hypothetical protein EYQ95_21155 [Lysobacter sp. N42]